MNRGLAKRVSRYNAAGHRPMDLTRNRPGYMNGLGYEKVGALEAALTEKKSEYSHANGRPMPPSVELTTRHELLYRWIYGAAPSDLRMGHIDGQKIKKSELQLCSPEDDQRFRMGIELATAGTTKMGNTTGDKAIVKSAWDNGLHGGTTGVISPPLLDRMLVKRPRSISMLPWMRQGIAPDLTYEALLLMNNAVTELFDGTDYEDIKTSSPNVKPRKEGYSGSFEIRAKFDNYNHTVRGYMGHTSASLESMTSRGGLVTQAWQRSLDMLMQSLGYIDEYDFVQALWSGIMLGYTRRYKASDGTWDVSTHAAPWGAANYITSNASKHWCWFNMKDGKFYAPSDDANYLKYSTAVAQTGGVFPDTDNKVIELLYKLLELQEGRNRKLEAAVLPLELLMMHGMDDRAQSKKYATEPNPRLQGEPGYVGDIVLLGSNEKVSIFKYQKGAVKRFADGDGNNIRHLIWGGELGQCVSYDVFWPQVLQLDKEYEVVTVDSLSRTRPTNQTVGTSFSMVGIEPDDLEAVSLMLVHNNEPPQG